MLGREQWYRISAGVGVIDRKNPPGHATFLWDSMHYCCWLDRDGETVTFKATPRGFDYCCSPYATIILYYNSVHCPLFWNVHKPGALNYCFVVLLTYFRTFHVYKNIIVTM